MQAFHRFFAIIDFGLDVRATVDVTTQFAAYCDDEQYAGHKYQATNGQLVTALEHARRQSDTDAMAAVTARADAPVIAFRVDAAGWIDRDCLAGGGSDYRALRDRIAASDAPVPGQRVQTCIRSDTSTRVRTGRLWRVQDGMGSVNWDHGWQGGNMPLAALEVAQ